MSIIPPSDSSGPAIAVNLKRTLPWVDAYTMVLRGVAEAKNNPDMIKQMKESLKAAEKSAMQLKTPQAIAIAQNQAMINKFMDFSNDDHKELKRLWKSASYR